MTTPARPIRSQYEDFMRHVYTNGVQKGDRTGTGTRSVFGHQMRFDLSHGFPLVTTKNVHFKSVVAELLWFLSGSTNNNDLEAMGCTIWRAWAREDGSLGPVYGEQWRNWPTIGHHPVKDKDGHTWMMPNTIDQIAALIEGIRTNPHSRRHIVSAWNVADLPRMALAPCHAMFQFDVTDGVLSCQLYQRSADVFLGVPFNIASYALLTHMVAQQCDLAVGDFIWTGGDCHIYDNHREQVALQLSRDPMPLPAISLTRRPPSIFDYTPSDIVLNDYNPHPAIKAPVAV